ncbi:MAG: HmuY family protein [Mediterranea sp.]|jgi:hypothetical protein|nr:HmuY family protein [Mediterranea sp.]
MNKKFIYSAFAILSLVFTASCSNDDDSQPGNQPGETKEMDIDASSKTEWHYYSFATGTVVGSADESEANNAAWGARKDWDIAIQRYNIRTNSGSFTTAGAKGGVCTLDAKTSFASLKALPEGATFAEDKAITSEGMGGTTTTVCSEATVILFKTDDSGSLVMPPVYLPAPVYIFRTASGTDYYKVRFTQYQDENKVAGKVRFDAAQLF